MYTHPVPSNENDRLKALNDYYILDTLKEDEFDRFTQLIAIICETPISLISLLDEKRQWFKSRVGLEVEQTSRELAFCQYTILENKIFQVHDATIDERFMNNELVTGNPNIKFYAGYPLTDAKGYALGSLCVIDRMPRQLSPAQEKALQLVAEEVTALIVQRREKEELMNFKKLFDQSDDLVCIAGYDGYFKKVNPAFTKLLGFSEKHFLNTSFLQLIHPEDIEATDRESIGLKQGNASLHFKNRYLAEDGSYKIIEWVTTQDRNLPVLYAIGRDITDQKKKDRLLEESETRFRSFFKNSQGLMYTHDLEGRFLSINENGAAALGYQPAEIQQKSLFDIVPEYKHKDLKRYLTYIKLRAKAGSLMTTIDTEGNKKIWAYSNVLCKSAEGTDYVIGNSIDLTERLQLERELKQTKEILEQTNRVARVGGWEYSPEHNRIYWTRMTREIHEVPDDFVVDLAAGVQFYKEGEDRDTISKAVTTAITTGQGWNLELKLITAKGKEVWVRAIGEAEMKAGNCIRLFGTFQDIDEQKQEAIRLQKSALLIRQQNDRLLNFAHIVSHNLRSHTGNLHSILALIHGESDAAEKINLISLLDTVSQTLNETIENLTEVVKVHTDMQLSKVPVRLETYFNSAIKVLSTLIQVERACVKGDFAGLPLVDHVPAYMDSIMLNFISNAIKYRHPGRAPEIKVTSFIENGKKTLTFSDNGIGIDLAKHGSRIFGMYKTFHKHPDARGIGLFITKNQIEAAGGSIEIQSEPGDGTTFRITL